MFSGVSKIIRTNSKVEQDRETIAKTKIAYETTIVKRFAHHKGSAPEFSKYLQSLQPNDIYRLVKYLARDREKLGSSVSDIEFKPILTKVNCS